MTDARPTVRCDGCDFARGENVTGGNVVLPGSWSVNHYAGSEGFLGWLALQPFRHVQTFAQLNSKELAALGLNIAKIETTLNHYWESTFGEPIEHLYVIYFLEGGSEHLHIHLIPRFKSLETRVRAWEIPRATMSATFPEKYRRDSAGFHSNVCCIMEHLKSNLVNGNGETA
jgi:diadenosine tetraphosphate (Ap4A) HIT family hydrolase